jgi:1-acyl-sn-glycerol-3-phosphate acyltransferase
VTGIEGLSREEWYMVVANHRSWVDILVLQKVLNRRAPFLKFFLKKELFWVPFLGLAWWCLDYPFLSRAARASRDLEVIRTAAGKFRLRPVSVMNFVEGTRFTPDKHAAQRSPYTHLLKPKAGGLTFILTEMGDRIDTLLDVTLVYPAGTPTLWSFLCGGVPSIQVRLTKRGLDPGLRGDFLGDKAFRREFTAWLNGIWAEKDELISLLLDDPPAPYRSGRA